MCKEAESSALTRQFMTGMSCQLSASAIKTLPGGSHKPRLRSNSDCLRRRLLQKRPRPFVWSVAQMKRLSSFRSQEESFEVPTGFEDWDECRLAGMRSGTPPNPRMVMRAL
jgi:hypothetical protein